MYVLGLLVVDASPIHTRYLGLQGFQLRLRQRAFGGRVPPRLAGRDKVLDQIQYSC